MTDDAGIQDESGHSRREMLRKAGIGVAVAWSAPMLIDSLTSSAAAVSGSPGGCVPGPCGNQPGGDRCLDQTDCGAPGANCQSVSKLDGSGCACVVPLADCTTFTPCTQDNDCATGQLCLDPGCCAATVPVGSGVCFDRCIDC